MNYYRSGWILFKEIANEGGHHPADFIKMKVKEANPDENKHVPFIKEVEEGYLVNVGKNEFHGNDIEHHLMIIDLYVDNNMTRHTFKLNEQPGYLFKVEKGQKVEAVSFCNLHGLHKYSL